MNPQSQKQPMGDKMSNMTTTKSDPVCGADVKSGDANAKMTTFRGESYSFCGEACRQKFEANPEQYTASRA